MTDPFADMSVEELLAADIDALSPEELAQWEEAYKVTPIGFVELVLGMELYDWQDDALDPLEDLMDKAGKVRRVQISVVAPNGSGKSQRVVAGAILYWLSVHPKGKVVFTTRDSKQLANQVWPALLTHKAKFPESWNWVTSPHHRISTHTGGSALLFTTNDEGRAEGWHKGDDIDAPLLIIIDEAKSVPDRIYSATDRCTFNARLEVSSPGKKAGRFYEGVKRNGGDGRIVVRVGLADCPHIPQSKIDSIKAEHGEDSPFTRSTLYGEFMDSEMRGRFDRFAARLDPQPGGDGKAVALVRCLPGDPTAWLWVWEPLVPGCRYLIVCDSVSGAEQQKGSDDPDAHAVLVLRDAYTDKRGQIHKPAVMARIIAPCHWFPEVLSERLAWLSRWLGNCTVAVEANNTGYAILMECKRLGVPLYQRTEGTPENPIRKLGFYQHAYIKPEIIKNLAKALVYRASDPNDPLAQGKEQDIDIWDEHLADELASFVVRSDGTEGAEPGFHDDDVMCLAIAWHCLPSGTIYREQIHQFSMHRGTRVVGATT
jgi:hypothetical protein